MILRYTYDKIYNNLKITTLLSYDKNSKQKCVLAGNLTIITCCFKTKHFILVVLVF